MLYMVMTLGLHVVKYLLLDWIFYLVIIILYLEKLDLTQSHSPMKTFITRELVYTVA